ncbi:acyltransferase [Tetragenococcus halophilus]|uniref:acyltransferase n=1 Tax=Tetragenococcus halophilus TaxID=51669 RepID=UPI001B3D590B|nr:hypothetical protein [Tetragenococcus halophilus]GFK28226.1 hypothetical protein YG2_06600 [Tetragenococcus halophilus]
MRTVEYIMSIPKTLYYNIKLLGFKRGKKLPLLINYKVKVRVSRDSQVKVHEETPKFGIRIGFYGTEGVSENYKSVFLVKENGTVKFSKNALLSKGISLQCIGGEVTIGDHFSTNKNLFVYCVNSIHFADNVLMGWNVTITDNDGHMVNKGAASQPVTISNKVWVGSETYVLKGAQVSEGNVIAARSTVTNKSVSKKNVLLASPIASIKKDDIYWEK